MPPYPASAPSPLGMTQMATQWFDTVTNAIDALPSPALYALVVGATIGVSLALLGSAKEDVGGVDGDEEVRPSQLQPSPSAITASSASASAPRTLSTATVATTHVPEPRWHWFRYMNGLILVAFLSSVVLEFRKTTDPSHHSSDNHHHASNDSSYSSSSWWVFLLGWSTFMCYFFGFFGITFVHKHLADTEPQAEAAAAPTPLRTSKAPPKAVSSDDDDRHNGPSKRRTSTTTTTGISKTLNPFDKGCGAAKEDRHLKLGDFPTNEHNNNTNNNDDDDPLDNSDTNYDSDDEYVQLVMTNRLKDHEIERRVNDCNRAVRIRRKALARKFPHLESSLDTLPHRHYDFGQVYGANCEIVVGYLPLPVGLAGPLMVNGASYHIPMATTEGCLVASTNRGCKALNAGGGVSAVVTADAITRAPCLRLPSATRAAAVKLWCHEPANFEALKQAFESTTSFGKLLQCQATVAGRNVYLRLSCFAGDAMGMNMVSKGSLSVVEHLAHHFPDLTLVALSGNLCTDKKAAATNWIHGRGKSVVAEATVPASIVKSVLKTTVAALVDTNLQKNLVGSAMAGTLGGFNAHASNIVTALFLATGQDPAQNVESSNCITLLEETCEGDLWISCTMPSLEVGTVGGGTSLPAQAACLDALGFRGSGSPPGRNAQTLATVVASAVVAGELSLLAALAANTLVQAHLQHNRKPATAPTTTKEA